jgi:hypothetical protein
MAKLVKEWALLEFDVKAVAKAVFFSTNEMNNVY